MSSLLFYCLALVLIGGILGIYIYLGYHLSQCQQQLSQCHTIDTITHLPNRQAFEKDFKKEGEDEKKQAVLLLNIDNFKRVNDLFGYHEGNRLIIEISKRIQDCLGTTEVLYHFGGDLFGIYFKDLVTRVQLKEMIQELMNALEKSFVLETTPLFISFFGGVAFYPNDAADFNELIGLAELSMYMAKKYGTSHYEFFTPAFLKEVEEQSLLENELRYGIDHDEFSLVYQPKVSLSDFKVTGYEALMRWENRILGNVPPDVFIKVAEETGLILPIGRWVLYESCMAIKRINAHLLVPKTIAVNISVREVLQDDFVTQVINIIKEVDIPLSWVEIELTESLFIKNKENIIKKLRDLQASGLSIAIDDFGKEYSALGYLIKLPINSIKIDKAFIDTIGTKEEWIVPTLIDICHKMKCSVIAEGAETKEQLEFLKAADCDKVQGYVLSKPLKEEELLGLHFKM